MTPDVGEYERLRPQIDAERRRIMATRRTNERTFFCPLDGCRVLAYREHAPVCAVHDVRMYPLPKDGER